MEAAPALRARVILVEQDRLALIRRVRDGQIYYVFPGGGVEHDETPQEAAIREAAEELGVEVELGPLVALARRASGSLHHFYVATLRGGTFGTGTGPEWNGDPARADRGTYEAVWLPIPRLPEHDVRPTAIAARIASGIPWDPTSPLEIED